MNKIYSVHDHWTDINKKNDVDIMSIDGVITGIKVNGEDYSGGGESDFSTAKVTVSNVAAIYGAFVSFDDECSTSDNSLLPTDHGSGVYTLILYKNKAHIVVEQPLSGSIEVSGNIEQYGLTSNEFIVSGDCTITIQD